ncbi:uncharacterized protein [Temnothorax longispinosus]|uniref:uncharacterized protein isoform X2 n=1 Tax=Temnothorax longispinosus TaxID=300112 RepID=UPI003A9914C2
MISVDCLHIRFNRLLLLTVGLWPYQRSKLVKLQFTLLFSVLATYILGQFATFLTSQCTPDLLINVLATALCYITFAINYGLLSINVEVIKCLLEQLQDTWDELTDENEINIIKQYAIYAKRYTIAFTAFFIGLIATTATGSMLIVFLQHACGMFQIACYRIARTMTLETLRKNSLQNEYLIYKGLICAVDMHRKAMKFSNSTISGFKIMFALLIITFVMCGSLNGFLIFQMISFECDIEELSLRVIFIIYYFTYMFVANYIGQEIMDHNDNVFVTVYNVQWYVAPLQIQKMILFLLQRNTKAFTLNYIGGLFVGSLKGAATLLNTGLSFFTVLRSVRN